MCSFRPKLRQSRSLLPFLSFPFLLEPFPLNSNDPMTSSSHVDHSCTENWRFRQTFSAEQHVLFQRGLVQSPQQNTDTDPVTRLFLPLVHTVSTLFKRLPFDLTRLQRNPSSTSSTALQRSGLFKRGSKRRHRDLHAVSPFPSPALTTWSNGAVLHIIAKGERHLFACFTCFSARHRGIEKSCPLFLLLLSRTFQTPRNTLMGTTS